MTANGGERNLAEGVGFEPTLRLPVNTLSKRAPSTARPPLRDASIGARGPTVGRARSLTEPPCRRNRGRSPRQVASRNFIAGDSAPPYKVEPAQQACVLGATA